MDHSGNAGESCEFIGCGKRRSVGNAGEESGFSDGWEADHANSGVSESADLKTLSGFALGSGLKQLGAVFSEFGLELTDVVLSCLVLLGTGDLLFDFSDLVSYPHQLLLISIYNQVCRENRRNMDVKSLV